ncbi:urease accessory protein [Promicromonospora umidemergens]|uniref:Urease accessory protein UreD n=1 Tax=Promicromonospora umidemergens TaxID=629679 RepID=A0ABP8XM67_9MICO|nr:urease accessory protein UreD [Promicromonospora umidemergens]MCP2282162.1 urease accessory protein [Promicromonospora umidemergens]
MRAHAKLGVRLRPGAQDTPRSHVSRLRSHGPLVLRPTGERLPGWLSRWGADPVDGVTVRLAAGAAGPLGGDHWRLDVEVGDGAALQLGAVSASLVLPGAHAARSLSETTISVGADAMLVWSPAAQIAAAGCRHAGLSRIDLAPGARLCAREEVVIGRYGEEPGDFAQRLRVTRSGEALYDQELAVGAASAGWNSPAVVADRKALGSIVVVDPATTNLDLFTAAVSPDVPDTAVMRLAPDAVLITSLAPDMISLRHRLSTTFAGFAATR